MRGTYDRGGGNQGGADASHFLYQTADDFNVTLDVEGPGVLYFTRYNHWHGSPWHYEVDGIDHLVQETSTADPDHPVKNSVFLPQALFPRPLAWTWSDTRGADLSWVPIPFTRSFRMAYARTHYGTGYYLYHQYVPGTKLSRPLVAWDGATPPDGDALKLIDRAGGDLAPRPGTPDGIKAGVREESGGIALPAGKTVTLARLANAPAMLRALELDIPKESAQALEHARLRITWDDRAQPSIDAPVALFFGSGTLYNRDGREYLVKAFPVTIRDDGKRVHLACYFPMPYFRSARIELVGGEDLAIPEILWSARATPYHDPVNHVAYFHATYADHPTPELGKDLVLLDTRKTEGCEHLSGHFVGTSFIFSHRADLATLEGDPRFFFDDSLTPQAQGTGTEEWGGGGDYWGGRNMTLPFAGHPVGAVDAKSARNEADKIESAYRFLLADLMPFGRNARICLEHGGTNESTEHYETVTYWYGAPGPSLVPTDELQIGDANSEQAHGYHSPDASRPYQITSRYEWGVDHLRGREVYPAHTDRGRSTTGTSEFTVTLEPRNLGVMLRRKLDYAFPNQRAEVSIADASRGQAGTEREWKPAGIWYLAGSNTYVHSNPKEELGSTRHVAKTSNRRFRDDEFLVPRFLTEGRSAVRVRIHFTPVNRPLFPGGPAPAPAWSEIRYHVYCFVMPAAPAAEAPASGPPRLKVVGNHLETPDGGRARLQGVNVASLEWSAQGENVLKSVKTAIDDWGANAIRLPLSQDRWFGKAPEQKDGGTAYRKLVQDVVHAVAARNAYVILDLHWSDAGTWGSRIGQHRMPDDNSLAFWKAVAPVYANHPAVLFGLYNEPFEVSWETWRDGGLVREKTGQGMIEYHSPGLQKLIDAVRAQGARNVVVAGGLDWAYDLSGIVKGFALADPSGDGILYDAHIYPWKHNWDQHVTVILAKHAVLAGECGCARDGKNEDPKTWAPRMLAYIERHRLNWTAWDFHPAAGPSLILDWNYVPTPEWGVPVQKALQRAAKARP